jgi:hypothetical protein
MAKLVSNPKPANWARRENWAEGTEDFKLTLPNQTYSDKLTFYDEETPVESIHLGPAHTDGDTVLVDVAIEGRRNAANIVKYIKMAASSNFGNILTRSQRDTARAFGPKLPRPKAPDLLHDALHP